MEVKKVFVYLCGIFLGFHGIVHATNETTTDSNADTLSDFVCYAEAEILDNCNQMSAYIKEATENQVIQSTSEELLLLIDNARSNFPPLVTTMHQKIDDVAAMGPVYARCIDGKRERVISMASEFVANLDNCRTEIRFLESGYQDQMRQYSSSSTTLCETSLSAVSSCVPNNDTDAAELCINSKVAMANSSFADEELTVSEYVDSSLEQVASIRFTTTQCVERAKRHAFDVTGYFLSLISDCIKNVNESSTTNPSTDYSTSTTAGASPD